MGRSWLRSVVIGVGLGVSITGPQGCTCQGRVTAHETSLAFEFPTDGAIVSALDDVNGSQPGVQINVSAVVSGLGDGAAVVLTNDHDLDSTGAPVPTSGKVQASRVVFAGYSLPPEESVLRVALVGVAADAACDGTQCDEVRVRAVQNICQFTTPRDGDILTSEQYPEPSDPFDPFEVDVVLDCIGVSEGKYVALRIMQGTPHVAPVDASGRVVFSRMAFAEGANQLAVSADTDANGDKALGSTLTATITIETGRCTARLSPDDGARLLASNDADLNPDNGMQANLLLDSDCAATSTVEVFVRGPADATPQRVTVGEVRLEGGRFLLGGVPLPESVSPRDVSVVARITEPAGGNFGVTVPTHYWVDSVAPQILNHSPPELACLGPTADTDHDLANGLQPSVIGQVSGAEDGAEVWVRVLVTDAPDEVCTTDGDCAPLEVCRVGLCRYVGLVAGGDFAVADVRLATGDVTLEFIALDLAGNTSLPALSHVRVSDVSPTVALSAPSVGARLGVAQDADPLVTGLQYDVQVNVTDAPDGDTGEIVISGAAPFPFVPPSGASGALSVRVTLADGAHEIMARIHDACGVRVESTAVSVMVASSPAALVVTAFESANNGFAQRRSIADGGYTAALAVDLDVYTGAGVSDRSVALTAYPEVNTTPGVRACLGTPTPIVTTTVLAAADGLLQAALPLGEGVNCLTITSDDGINALTTVLVLHRQTSAPAITISSPSAGSFLTDADPKDGINTDIVVDFAAPSVTTGELQVLVSEGGLPRHRLRALVGAGVAAHTFAGASLPCGALSLTAVYSDSLGNAASTSPAMAVTTTCANPSFALSSPQGGDVVRSADLVVALTAMGLTGVQACTVFDGLGAGAPVALAIPAWDASGAAFNASLTTLSEGAHRLRAECTDAGSSTTYSQVVDFRVSDSAPGAPTLVNEQPGTPGQLRFDIAGAYVNALVPDTSSMVGLQHPVAVLVPTGGEDPRGWRVQLTVTPPGVAPITYERLLGDSAQNPLLVTFESAEFGVNDGALTVSCVLVDALGRASLAATASWVIDRSPPVVDQRKPIANVHLWTGQDDANTDPQYVDLVFSYDVTGALAGSSIELAIAPPPAGRLQTDPPLSAVITSGRATFAPIAFADASYIASARAVDAAGNETHLVYTFDVLRSTPSLTWAIPTAPNPPVPLVYGRNRDVNAATPGLQASFIFGAASFLPGTTVTLCSTLATTASPVACRWGFNGTLAVQGGANAGYIVATGGLQGTLANSSVIFAGATLAEGDQVLHAEAREADGQPDVAASFVDFTVDSVPPVITELTLLDNVAGNDGLPTMRMSVTAGEGTLASGTLRTRVTVGTSGTVAGATVTVVSSYPSPGTLVGSGVLDATLHATFDVFLPNAVQTLAAVVHDSAGNANDPALNGEPAPQVSVDLTAGAATLPVAAAEPYTANNGTIDPGAAPGRTDDALRIAVAVAVSDNRPLASGTVSLARYDAGGGEIAGSRQTVALTSTQVSGQAVFNAFLLPAGINRLRATFTDAAGNMITTSTQLYRADFYGPLLTLGATKALANGDYCVTPPCCTALADACLADLYLVSGLPLFDTAASQPYSPPLRVTAYQEGTRLTYAVAECANAAPVDACDITVRLESRIAGSSDAFALVGGGALHVLADVGSTVVPAVTLTPGVAREFRLSTLDSNGNLATSPSVFLQLDLDGAVIEVQRTLAGVPVTPVADILVDDRFFGTAENAGPPTAFAADFALNLTMYGTHTPVNVALSVNGATTGPGFDSQPFSGGHADFAAVALVSCSGPSDIQYNTLTFTVKCDEGAGSYDCGTRTYSGIVADLAAPLYQFDRCSLCALNVPLAQAGACASTPACQSANADGAARISPAASAWALWNLALDADHDGNNGFNVPTPLIVLLTGVANGTSVTVKSDHPTLTGATATAIGCDVGNCRAEFGSLTATSLGGNLKHTLSVEFKDAAGNIGKTDPLRTAGQEIITALTDVIAPAAVTETVCIGESTTPSTGVVAASDARTYETAECTTACAASGTCDRRLGKATILWNAPGDDGANGAISDYRIVIAALGMRYQRADNSGLGSPVTDCANVTADNGVERVDTYAASAAPGTRLSTSVTGLYPHRAYCMRVEGVDDAGNAATQGSSSEQRVLPLLSYPGVQDFTVWQPYAPFYTGTQSGKDDANSGLSASAAAYTDPGSNSNFGITAANVGDLDGNGRPELAVSRELPSRAVLLFSGAAPATPTATINEPSVVGAFFGYGIAGGDFDGDGYSDLAICAPFLNTSSGLNGGDLGGALYLYYGSATGIRKVPNATDPLLPSLVPDVALFGPPSAMLCFAVMLANIDGQPGDDLVVGAYGTAKTYGFLGGTRNRFPGTAPVKVWLDLTSSAQSGFTTRPDFALAAKTPAASVGFYPGALAAPDLNGDGIKDLAVGDFAANHHQSPDSTTRCDACGEIYVYRGGTALQGEISGIVTPTNAAGAESWPPQMLNVLRFARAVDASSSVSQTSEFGYELSAVHRPRAADSADWVAAKVSVNGERRVVLFKGSQTGGQTAYPPNGLPYASYALLDNANWDGSNVLPAAAFGDTIADLGAFFSAGSVDLAVGPGVRNTAGTYGVFIYSYSASSDDFVKRAILYGEPGFGTRVVGVGNFLGLGAGHAAQLGVAKALGSGTGSALFIYR